MKRMKWKGTFKHYMFKGKYEKATIRMQLVGLFVV
jgi:hypothetical protein